jgi:hypothetical protein
LDFVAEGIWSRCDRFDLHVVRLGILGWRSVISVFKD